MGDYDEPGSPTRALLRLAHGAEEMSERQHQHCWHALEHLLSLGKRREVCCWCGSKRTVISSDVPQFHGAYQPGQAAPVTHVFGPK